MTAAGTPADLDVYEVAYLAGGAARAVEAAVVALVESGRLRVRSPGELIVASLIRRHPVEAAVLDAFGPAGHRSVETVCWRVAEDPRLAGLAARLEREGLLAPARRRLLRRGGRPDRTAAGRRTLRALRATSLPTPSRPAPARCGWPWRDGTRCPTAPSARRSSSNRGPSGCRGAGGCRAG